jgi:hypothetical protein
MPRTLAKSPLTRNARCVSRPDGVAMTTGLNGDEVELVAPEARDVEGVVAGQLIAQPELVVDVDFRIQVRVAEVREERAA